MDTQQENLTPETPAEELKKSDLTPEISTGKMVIKRKGYTVYIFPVPEGEKELTDLRNTGKGLGEININSMSEGDAPGEIVIAVEN